MKEEGKGAKYYFYEVMITILKLGVYKQPCLDQETDLELTNLFAHNPDDLHSPFLHIYSVNLLELYEILCTTKKLVKVPKCYIRNITGKSVLCHEQKSLNCYWADTIDCTSGTLHSA